jgi:hypothetical protein
MQFFEAKAHGQGQATNEFTAILPQVTSFNTKITYRNVIFKELDLQNSLRSP